MKPFTCFSPAPFSLFPLPFPILALEAQRHIVRVPRMSKGLHVDVQPTAPARSSADSQHQPPVMQERLLLQMAPAPALKDFRLRSQTPGGKDKHFPLFPVRIPDPQKHEREYTNIVLTAFGVIS